MNPYLGCYGHPFIQSPHIDAFAKESILFEDAHCQVALCTPSRTSILTGIRPSTSGIVKIDDDWQAMIPQAVSLPRHFRDRGYMTWALGKISDPRNGGMDDAWDVKQEEWGIKDNELALVIIDSLAQSIQDQPFFLAIGYKQTHDPWTPAPKHQAKYPIEDIELLGEGTSYKNETFTEEEVRHFVRDYYASISEVDSLIGEVIRHLKEKSLYEQSIVIVGSLDHGFSLGFHNKWGKTKNYDPETLVPLLIRLPHHPMNGHRISQVVELLDLYPTLVDYCELPSPPQQLQGISMRPLLESSQTSWKEAAISHEAYHVQNIGIKTSNYTLILNEAELPQLFDRKKDPRNLFNIAAENPEVVEKLESLSKKMLSGE